MWLFSWRWCSGIHSFIHWFTPHISIGHFPVIASEFHILYILLWKNLPSEEGYKGKKISLRKNKELYLCARVCVWRCGPRRWCLKTLNSEVVLFKLLINPLILKLVRWAETTILFKLPWIPPFFCPERPWERRHVGRSKHCSACWGSCGPPGLEPAFVDQRGLLGDLVFVGQEGRLQGADSMIVNSVRQETVQPVRPCPGCMSGSLRKKGRPRIKIEKTV